MSKLMTPEQREFWEAVQCLARATRRGKSVDLEAAADALALEQEIEARFAAEAAHQDNAALRVAENASNGGTDNGG